MFENARLGQAVDKATFDAREPGLREELLDVQFRLREAGFSVVVVIAGAEGAGKGETVNLLLNWLDARGIATHALGAPTEEERERPEYRGIAHVCPSASFSWYSDRWIANSRRSPSDPRSAMNREGDGAPSPSSTINDNSDAGSSTPHRWRSTTASRRAASNSRSSAARKRNTWSSHSASTAPSNPR